MDSNDYAIAKALQKKFDDEVPSIKTTAKLSNIGAGSTSNFLHSSKSLVDPEWELIDPNPDIFVLFQQYDKAYFWNALSMVEVRWSPRMTLCAGLCCYEGRGMLCSIRLSQPLLKLRPRKDLVETLLHEMIHAYLFVTANNKDRDGHGPEFCKHMDRINAIAGTNITIYHSFHDEVDEMRKHWWRCTGPCRNRPPYFGYVKRAMNRQPSKNDFWWNDHQKSCGGTYIKIKEPENYGKKSQKSTQMKSGEELHSVPDPTQKRLNFDSRKKKIDLKGNVLGGFALPKNVNNPRGIPLNSRLLNSLNHNVTSAQNNSQNSSRKPSMSSPNLQKPIFSSRTKSENLFKVCQEMRRTGSKSVNENAPAYSICKVKTKFALSKRKRSAVLFDSDDELVDINSVSASNSMKRKPKVLPAKKSISDCLTSSSPSQKEAHMDTITNLPKFESKNYSSNESDISDVLKVQPQTNTEEFLSTPSELCKTPIPQNASESDNLSSGNKRKYASVVPLLTSSSFRSPLKKKPNSEMLDVTMDESVCTSSDVSNVVLSDNPSTSKDSFIGHHNLSTIKDPADLKPKNSNVTLPDCNKSNVIAALDVPTTSQGENNSVMPSKVACPVCTAMVPFFDINMHIDMCLSLKAIHESSF